MRPNLSACYGCGVGAALLLVDAGAPSDVFELIEQTASMIVVRSPFLFEIGEELKLRLDGKDVAVRVRSHRADGSSELEIV